MHRVPQYPHKHTGASRLCETVEALLREKIAPRDDYLTFLRTASPNFSTFGGSMIDVKLVQPELLHCLQRAHIQRGQLGAVAEACVTKFLLPHQQEQHNQPKHNVVGLARVVKHQRHCGRSPRFRQQQHGGQRNWRPSCCRGCPWVRAILRVNFCLPVREGRRAVQQVTTSFAFQ